MRVCVCQSDFTAQHGASHLLSILEKVYYINFKMLSCDCVISHMPYNNCANIKCLFSFPLICATCSHADICVNC